MKNPSNGSTGGTSRREGPRRLEQLTLLALLVASCGGLWPFDNPGDPARCDPRCTYPDVCRDGECRTLATYGDDCRSDADCVTNICAKSGKGSVCTQECGSESHTCPPGDPCVDAGSMKVCVPSSVR